MTRRKGEPGESRWIDCCAVADGFGRKTIVVKQVLFASQAEAEKLAGLSDWIVISITGPADPPAALKEGWGDILRLSFDDIDFAQDDMRPISAEDATRLVQFVRKYADTVDGVLVHCLAGISRSAAVAKFIAEKYQLPFP